LKKDSVVFFRTTQKRKTFLQREAKRRGVSSAVLLENALDAMLLAAQGNGLEKKPKKLSRLLHA